MKRPRLANGGGWFNLRGERGILFEDALKIALRLCGQTRFPHSGDSFQRGSTDPPDKTWGGRSTINKMIPFVVGMLENLFLRETQQQRLTPEFKPRRPPNSTAQRPRDLPSVGSMPLC